MKFEIILTLLSLLSIVHALEDKNETIFMPNDSALN
jgi:hypothetical protein